MHQRSRDSIGSSASLFGAASNDDDFLTQLSPGAASSHPSASHPPGQQQSSSTSHSDQPQQQHYFQGPDAGRADGGGAMNDPRHQQFSANGGSEQYGQHQQQKQYSAPDASNYSAQQSDSSAAYGSTTQSDYQNYDYAASSTNGDYSNAAAPSEGEYVEPQYYPGYLYDYASNSYLEDPNYQPEEQQWSPEDEDQVNAQASYEGSQVDDMQSATGESGVNAYGAAAGWGYRSGRSQEESVEEYDHSRDSTATGIDSESWENRAGAETGDSWDRQQQQAATTGAAEGHRNDLSHYDSYPTQPQSLLPTDPQPSSKASVSSRLQQRQPVYEQSYTHPSSREQQQQQYSQAPVDGYAEYQPYQQQQPYSTSTQDSLYTSDSHYPGTIAGAALGSPQIGELAQQTPIASSQPSFSPQQQSNPMRNVYAASPERASFTPSSPTSILTAPTPPPRNFATRPPPGSSLSSSTSSQPLSPSMASLSALQGFTYAPVVPTASIAQALAHSSNDSSMLSHDGSYSNSSGANAATMLSPSMTQRSPQPSQSATSPALEHRTLSVPYPQSPPQSHPQSQPQLQLQLAQQSMQNVPHHHHNLSNIAEGYENASSVGEPVDSRDSSFSPAASQLMDYRSNDGGDQYSDYDDNQRIDPSWEHSDDPVTTSQYGRNHDPDAAARATEAPIQTAIFPPPRTTFNSSSSLVANSAPLPYSAGKPASPTDPLSHSLAAVTLEVAPAVQLRRRSFGKREATASPPARKAADTTSLAGITEADQFEQVDQHSTSIVPELSVEAPSPEEPLQGLSNWGGHRDAASDSDLDDYVPNGHRDAADRTVVDLDLEEDDSLLRDQPASADSSYLNGYSDQYSQPHDQQQQQEYGNQQQYQQQYQLQPQEFEYGLDSSSVFDDNTGVLSNASQGSGYGEWNGNQETDGGYDYVNDVHAIAPSASSTDLYRQQPSSEVAQSQYPQQDSQPFPQTSTPLIPSQQSAASRAPAAHDPYTPSAPSQLPTSPQQSLRSVSTARDAYAYAPPNAYAPYSSNQSTSVAAPSTSKSCFAASVPALALPLADLDPSLLDPYAATRRYDHYAGHQSEVSSPSGLSFAATHPDLGLRSSSAPVVRFGFGGRLIIVFPHSLPTASLYGQYSSSLAAPRDTTPSSPSTVHIRRLVEIVPEIDASFPGPIFMDGGNSNAGKKRKESIAWLEQRIQSLEEHMSYRDQGRLSGQEESKSKARSKLILVKIVKILVENNGQLTGSAKVDEAVRSILAPTQSDGALDYSGQLPLASELALAASRQHATNGSPSSTIAAYSVTSSNLDTLSSLLIQGDRLGAMQYALQHRLWAHAFVIANRMGAESGKEVITEFIRSELCPQFDSNGSPSVSDGREALRVAYSLFSGSGADSVSHFVPARPLAFQPTASTSLSAARPLRAAVPLSRASSPAPLLDASFPTDLSVASLAKWQETAAIIVANRTTGDSAALTRLGDTLSANGWFEAAHVCYLLSPATSPIGGVGSNSARIVLVGGESPSSTSTAGISLESIMLTELVEFAFSLTPLVKGQELFAGFPHLQAFRLHHANQLVDAGSISQAQRYTDAIVGTLKLAEHSSPFYHSGLVAQVKALSDRVLAAPGQVKGGSWIARKVPRPTIDSLWSTLEGRFSKFVAGEGEDGAQEVTVKPEVAAPANGVVGPFSHYSAISPAVSAAVSRRQSQNELSIIHPSAQSFSNTPLVSSPLSNHVKLQPPILPPHRPTSAASMVSPSVPINTAGPPPTSSRGSTFSRTHHARSSSLGFAGYNYDPSAPPPWQSYIPPVVASTRPTYIDPNSSLTQPIGSDVDAPYGEQRPDRSSSTSAIGDQQEQRDSNSAYDQSSARDNYVNSRRSSQDESVRDNITAWDGADELNNSTKTLRAPVFSAVEEGSFMEDASGFISPMAAFTPAPSPGPPSSYSPLNPSNKAHQRNSTRAELDDLGIGNSTSRSKKPGFDSIDEHAGEGEDSSAARASASKDTRSRPEIKPSKSWLGGWFKRETGASPQPIGPGPVKANLGEQTSFVFDPVLKKWVNKKTGSDVDIGGPLATAPPPRAATASPSRSRATYGSGTPPPPMPDNAYLYSSLGAPPLNRSRTSADLGEMNRISAGEFRASSTGPSAIPPRSLMSPPPGASRGGSGTVTPVGGARRKPLKSRYVALS